MVTTATTPTEPPGTPSPAPSGRTGGAWCAGPDLARRLPDAPCRDERRRAYAAWAGYA
jgi:hypothetical protein